MWFDVHAVRERVEGYPVNFGICLQISPGPMSNFTLPGAAVPADIPRPLRLQIVSSCAAPPEGDGWLQKAKHDGHRLVAIIADGDLRLVSRNGHDRTALFRVPFEGMNGAAVPGKLAAALPTRH